MCKCQKHAHTSAKISSSAGKPFFTTKPIGQGTGLGLSMVYGFVRQSGGQIRVKSELGQGTTVAMYFPRYRGESAMVAAVHEQVPLLQASGEVLLLIDDEETIRVLAAEALVFGGYRVLQAADGATGRAILQTGTPIDLLITDVGLPGGINGRQVADAARLARPHLKVLFITGYAEKAAVGNRQLESGMHVLTKPFDVASLILKVRQLVSAVTP